MMAKKTPEEKAANARARMLETAKGCNYKKRVATQFQLMIRAEFGADDSPYVPAVVDGSIRHVARDIGQVVCVTCGDVYWWKDPRKRINTGHFISRKKNATFFDPMNVGPQCVTCNKYRHGERGLFEIWVRHIYGAAEVERLQRLKNESRKFTTEELVDMMIGFQARLKAAVAFIEGATA